MILWFRSPICWRCCSKSESCKAARNQKAMRESMLMCRHDMPGDDPVDVLNAALNKERRQSRLALSR